MFWHSSRFLSRADEAPASCELPAPSRFVRRTIKKFLLRAAACRTTALLLRSNRLDGVHFYAGGCLIYVIFGEEFGEILM